MSESSSRIGFLKLLKNNIVEIPIIQRDYAQGREDKLELRTNFLNSLKSAIIEKTGINLDFIYGSISNDVMQPLDGQQRLTTLFLIHWYAAIKDSKLSGNSDLLKKFTYETRTSSREFCVSLIEQSIDSLEQSTILSREIRNSIWYFLNWDNDPTIDSMLRTLDDIHKMFYDVDNLWDILSEDKPLISFYYIELSNFGLSDDLYIKMNARGKELTAFENFKATFEKYLENNKWDMNRGYNDSFSLKVDTIWTDLFWKNHTNPLIDSPMLSFFATIAMIHFALEKVNDRHKFIRILNNSKDNLKAEMITENAYNYLHKCADKYHDLYNKTSDFNLPIQLDAFISGNDIFKSAFCKSSNSSYTQKVIFFAQSEYLLNVDEYNETNFYDWMRVIRNIIYRGDYNRTSSKTYLVRSPEAFDGVISLVNELSSGSENIYEYLISCNVKSQIAKTQIDEEIEKAKLIKKDITYKKIIHDAEDMRFTAGSIQLIFNAIDYDRDVDNFDADKFIKITNVIKEYIDPGISDEIRRLLLTIEVDGKYEFYNYWWSWSQAVNGNKRCLIAKDNELEYFVFGKFKDTIKNQEYIKTLLNLLVEDKPENILNSFSPPESMPNWKARLIKEPDLLEIHCKSKYIVIPQDEKSCYLLKGIRPRDISGTYRID